MAPEKFTAAGVNPVDPPGDVAAVADAGPVVAAEATAVEDVNITQTAATTPPTRRHPCGPHLITVPSLIGRHQLCSDGIGTRIRISTEATGPRFAEHPPRSAAHPMASRRPWTQSAARRCAADTSARAAGPVDPAAG